MIKKSLFRCVLIFRFWISCLDIFRSGSPSRWGWTYQPPGKKKGLSQSAWRAGPAGPPPRTPTLCTKRSNVTKSVFALLLAPKSRLGKPDNMARSCGLLPLFPSLRWKFSSILISFIHIRVKVVPPPSSRCNFSVSPIQLSVVGLYICGLTSSTTFLRRKGRGNLFSIPKYRRCQSRLETCNFLWFSDECYCEIEPRIKVTSPLQMPSAHHIPFWLFWFNISIVFSSSDCVLAVLEVVCCDSTSEPPR